ncbi:E3 ubiquitin ligase TRIM40 [Drosophila tropicalis]|uniref:E3 ubiquitin ligase TRIM40 n=1 Tax=Drosophila tropicalis TaxID=46794 RepID=UPI0035ABFAAE
MNENREYCAVCLSLQRHRVSTACRHSFCKQCIKEVYNVCPARVCPLCRAPLEYYIRQRRSGVKIVFFS